MFQKSKQIGQNREKDEKAFFYVPFSSLFFASLHVVQDSSAVQRCSRL